MADIGGSNACFGWVTDNSGEIQHVKTFAGRRIRDTSRRQPSLFRKSLSEGNWVPLIGAPRLCSLRGCDPLSVGIKSISRIAIGVGSQAQVKAALNLDTFLTLNDFEAPALFLPRPKAHQIKPHADLPQHTGTPP